MARVGAGTTALIKLPLKATAPSSAVEVYSRGTLQQLGGEKPDPVRHKLRGQPQILIKKMQKIED